MKFSILICLSPILLLTLGCKEAGKAPVTRYSDYAAYLHPDPAGNPLYTIDREMDFWSRRLAGHPGDMISQSRLASLNTRRFAYSGDVSELYRADSLYRQAGRLGQQLSSGNYRSLAANCIMRHRFRDARAYIDSALRMGDKKYISTLMDFDISLELGDNDGAARALASIADQSSFEFCIRQAKYLDHVQGNLPGAIIQMEKAWDRVKDKSETTLRLWTLSNLADMYAHNNQPEQSYQAYLQVLKADPYYYHALKGIAWLAYSQDRNPADGRRILEYLRKVHQVPEYNLLLGEMEAFQRGNDQHNAYLESFVQQVRQPQYGGMYNKYLITLESDYLNDPAAALQLAETEVGNRPTAEVYSWLAWALFRNGRIREAKQIVQSRVEGKCFEPQALYRMGRIYWSAGDRRKGRRLLKQAGQSPLELGPLLSGELKKWL